jgi:class 3 adenylate cyclase
MRTKHTSQSPVPAKPARTAPAPWNWAAELGQQQMTVAAEGATALFRGFEAMRKIQERAAHEASRHHGAVAERLRGRCQPTDLLAIQSELMRCDVEGATRYWQQLMAAAVEMNTELLGCAAHLVNTEDVFAATGPFIHSWKT